MKANYTTQDEGSAKDLPIEELEGACTIRVEIVCKIVVGSVNHVHQDQEHYIPSTSVLHEDSKPALWGLSAM
jgi:desulfoferrodoxin (superoxide reductase-like protein)